MVDSADRHDPLHLYVGWHHEQVKLPDRSTFRGSCRHRHALKAAMSSADEMNAAQTACVTHCQAPTHCVVQLVFTSLQRLRTVPAPRRGISPDRVPDVSSDDRSAFELVSAGGHEAGPVVGPCPMASVSCQPSPPESGALNRRLANRPGSDEKVESGGPLVEIVEGVGWVDHLPPAPWTAAQHVTCHSSTTPPDICN